MKPIFARVGRSAPAEITWWRWVPLVLSAMFGLVVVLGLAMAPVRALHVSAPSVTLDFEAAMTLLALAAGGLWLLEFGADRRARTLCICLGLLLVGLTDFVLEVVPAVTVSSQVPDHLGILLAAMALAAVAFVAAALVPAGATLPRRRDVIGPVAALLGLGVIFWLAVRIGGVRQSESTDDAVLAVRIVAGVIMTTFAVAAAGFLVRWRNRREGPALAAGSLLLAVAGLSRLRIPLADPGWLTPAAPLLIVAYAAFLRAARIAFTRTRERARRDVAAAERLRIANDLHDGLAQDLSFIVAFAERLASEHGDEHPVVVAARRALQVSRGVMVDLAATGAPSTEAALREIAAELEARFQLEVHVEADAARPEPMPAQRRQIVRIAREAIANAARHGDARRIEVSLPADEPETLLRIRDDGRGMDRSAAPSGTGLGLGVMRARAAALGGRLVADSRAEGGTEVVIVADDEPPVATIRH